MAVPISRVKSSSLQKIDLIEIRRFEIRKVTGSTVITSISCDVAGIKIKLNIEKAKMTKRARKYFLVLTFLESYCCIMLALPTNVKKISKVRNPCKG